MPVQATSAMERPVDVGPVERSAPGKAVVVTAWNEAIALFNVKGTLFALEDACLRCGSSLAAGMLEGTWVTCPDCDWRFDVTTGCVNGIPALQLNTYDVSVVDSRVMLDWARIPRGRTPSAPATIASRNPGARINR